MITKSYFPYHFQNKVKGTIWNDLDDTKVSKKSGFDREMLVFIKNVLKQNT